MNYIILMRFVKDVYLSALDEWRTKWQCTGKTREVVWRMVFLRIL